MTIEYKKDQIYEYLKREILGGQLYPGSKLPREVELAKRLSIGHVTLRSALAQLEAEGLVERIHGKGTFVAQPSNRRTFLLLLPDGTENIESPSRYIVEGIEKSAWENAVTLEKCSTSLLNSLSMNDYKEMMQSHSISGIILETGRALPEEETISRLKSLPMPVVIPHGGPTDSAQTSFAVLRTDERAAFGDGLRYLAKFGHRRIASIFLKLPNEDTSRMRGFLLQELLEFYRYNDLEESPLLIKHIDKAPESIIRTVRELQLGPLPPTAIMCHSDRVAMRVYQALKELNMKIPQQISIMGYSNYPGSQLLSPPLSTIDVGFQQCGELALIHLLNSKEWYRPGETPSEVFTPYKILERKSVQTL